MESTDGYDYSLTGHHLKPFLNPLKDEPFIGEMEDTYGTLWEFKEHIAFVDIRGQPLQELHFSLLLSSGDNYIHALEHQRESNANQRA